MLTTAKMGLTSWNQEIDPYNPAQLAANWQTLDFHDHSPGRGTPVAAGGLAPGAVLSNSIAAGVIGLQHLSPTVLQDLGLNWGSQVGRGTFVKAAADTTTSTTFTSLGDLVSGLVLNTGGLIVLNYHALWKTSNGADAVSADVFVGANELINASTGGVLPASTTSTSLVSVFSSTGALLSGSTTWTVDFTTGVSAGAAPVYIYAAPGTYTVGIQFKVASGGTLTVQNRQLWVNTINFS